MSGQAQTPGVLYRVKKASLIIAERLRAMILGDLGFMERAKVSSKNFTRRRLLPFSLVMFMVMRLMRVSLQNEVENIFKWLRIPKKPPTGEALSKARNNIRWQAFEEMFHNVVEWRYECEDRRTWHGYRVSAIDGTKLALPIDRDGKLLLKYGGMGVNGTSPTGQGSILYDICNDVIIDAGLEPLETSERDLAMQHIERLKKLNDFGKELIIFDRGYPSLDLMCYLEDEGITFVMRVKRNFNQEIDKMETGCDTDLIIPSPYKNIHGQLSIRVLKFDLPSGETEALVTNLFDKRMGINAFRQLYFKRWPVETEYDIVKNKLEVEHFSGLTENAVKQEFYATMLVANYAACLAREAQEEADNQRIDKDNKYDYQININHEIGILRSNFIDILIEEDPVQRAVKLQNVLELIARAVEPVRPERSKPRDKPRAVKHHHNRKPNR